MKRAVDDYCFWVTPASDRWRVDVHLKEQIDEDDGEVAEPLTNGYGATAGEALADAVAKAEALGSGRSWLAGQDDAVSDSLAASVVAGRGERDAERVVMAAETAIARYNEAHDCKTLYPLLQAITNDLMPAVAAYRSGHSALAVSGPVGQGEGRT